jgi:HNH endonuclease
MLAEPGWCGVCGLPVPAGERLCRWPFGGRSGDGQDNGAPWASHSLAFMTELAELQHWRCPWCGDYLPDSPRGTAIDRIIPRVYGGPHRRWNLQLLHQECNSAKGKKITAGALDLAGAHGVTISTDIGQYRAGSAAGRPSMPCGPLASPAARPATGLWPQPGISPCSSPRQGFVPSSEQRLRAGDRLRPGRWRRPGPCSRREPHGKTTTPITPGQPLRQTPPHPSADYNRPLLLRSLNVAEFRLFIPALGSRSRTLAPDWLSVY